MRELCIGEFDDGWPEGFWDFSFEYQIGNDNFFLDFFDDILIELSLKSLQILGVSKAVT